MSALPLWLLTLFQWVGAVVLSAAIAVVVLKLTWVTAQATHYLWFVRRAPPAGEAPAQASESGLRVFALKWLEVLMFGVAPEPTAAGLWQGWRTRRRG